MTRRELEGPRKLAELSNGRGAVEGPQSRLREEGVVQQRDVAVAAEDLRVGSHDLVVEMGEEFVGGEPADGADDGLDFWVEEGVVDLETAEEDGVVVGWRGEVREEDLDAVPERFERCSGAVHSCGEEPV